MVASLGIEALSFSAEFTLPNKDAVQQFDFERALSPR